MDRRHFLIASGGLVLTAGPAAAQFFPKTLIDRAIEARSFGDIAKDNEVVLKVNKVMADAKTASASTEIYEQRLLLTGMFDDKATYDQFEKGVKAGRFRQPGRFSRVRRNARSRVSAPAPRAGNPASHSSSRRSGRICAGRAYG